MSEELKISPEVSAMIQKQIFELEFKYANENATLRNQLGAAREFHPRAMKLLEKQKPFIVVACDEPYYLQVYGMIRQHEMEIGRWTYEDEQLYLAEIARIGVEDGSLRISGDRY